jgi:hydroxymethylpyrimidine pyrophosphatase-like HAD family hydrolase
MGTRPVVKIMVRSATDTEVLRRPLQDVLGTAARVVRSQTPGTLELVDRGADKRHAAAYVARRLGVRREDTLAVGDGTNDLGLLLWAGTSVAPSDSGASARRAARILCGPNTEDGVAGLFESLLVQT